MNSTASVLKRWREMDAALCPASGWMNVRRFAEAHGVSTRTVRRDLKAFQQLGQRMECVHPGPGSEEVRDYVWRYLPGVPPLFTVNLGRKREPPA
jgi:hypothetical protein